MSFDRPGLPQPGDPGDEVENEETLEDEGLEVTDGRLDGADRPGGPSPGPQPNPPRRPGEQPPV
ncbi:hypothetical protein Kfla_0777 [Kribbella flavida DSM 17836]|uniref:Uncharacterized protein n=1 Tax=Kribbella flavida (strain DSM 17836 / JCM 10339 / NBRC 14399) TaxID=479435 RepID=D2PYQ0_KRIFD|nr:hypothetical protein [Kribbella flavida]ADB29896.1 hypothetical protein Kfla_0777 [Kribbella flavida DSM 17836]